MLDEGEEKVCHAQRLFAEEAQRDRDCEVALQRQAKVCQTVRIEDVKELAHVFLELLEKQSCHDQTQDADLNKFDSK